MHGLLLIPLALRLFEPPLLVHYPPAVSEASARQLAIELKQALQEACSAFGSAPLSGPLEVELHATTPSYRRASGAAWWHAAIERGGRLHFQPLANLERQGIRRRVIRHEAAHLALAARLGPALPRWRQEGEAMRFAGERGALNEKELLPTLEAVEQALAVPADEAQTRRAYLSAAAFVRRLNLPLDTALGRPAPEAYAEFHRSFPR
jgi:hypothetical protein